MRASGTGRDSGSFLPGQDAGFLGAAFDPFLAGDPSLPGYSVLGLDLPRDIPLDRIGRCSLLDDLDRALDSAGLALDGLDDHQHKAFSLVPSPEARRAFDLSQEPASVRERYGLDPDNPRKLEA